MLGVSVVNTKISVNLSFQNGKQKEWETFFSQKFSNKLWNSTKKKIYSLIKDAFYENNASSRISSYYISVSDMDSNGFIVSSVVESYDCVYDSSLPKHFSKLKLSNSKDMVLKK